MPATTRLPIRVLCAVNGAFSSHVARVLTIALRLREYPEFELAFSGSGPFMRLAEEQGFEVIPTDHLGSDEVFRAADETGIHWYDDADRLAELFAADQAVFADWRPDVCLRDAFRDPASVVSTLSDVLDVMVTQANETPAFKFDFVPVNYDLQGTQIELTHLDELVRMARRKVYQPIYQKAKELGVPPEQCRDFGTAAELYLVADSYALYPLKSVPTDHRFVGPLLRMETAAPPPWLTEFADTERTKLLITAGSTGQLDFGGFFAAVDPDRRDYALAFTDEAAPPDFGGLGNAVTAVLPHADLFVTHGGLGSTYLGLLAAKPMIVLYDQFERQANAHQLEKIGVGVGFHGAQASADQVIASAQRLLGDPSVGNQLQKFSALLKTEPEGSRVAATELVAACAQRYPQLRERLETIQADLRVDSENHRLGNEDWVKAMTEPELPPAQPAASHDHLADRSQPDQTEVITVSDLRKTYGALNAVDGISFEVRRGEVFGLLGPNGAGKSTTIEILTGNRRRDGGSVQVLGLDPGTQDAALKQRIGVQLQDVRLFKNITVRETLDLFASFYDDPRPVAEVIERVGLAEKTDERVSRLSGGQTQRVGIAASMIGRGEILFMDEPTAGLDPKNRRLLMDSIRQIRGGETTVFLTTHFMDEAQKLCDRVAIIDQGRLIALDTPDKLVAEHCPETVVRIEPQPGFTPQIEDEISALGQTTKVDGVLVCYCDNVVTFISGLAAIYARHDLEMADVAIHQATLEDVFLKLTGRKVEQ